jgi:hypothetical protein
MVNNMKHIRTILEVTPTRVQILESKNDDNGDPTLRVAVKWQQAEKINGNKRRYHKSLLEREIKKLQPKIEEGAVWGSTFHPEDGIGTIDDISHQWEKIAMDEKTGECTGEILVLPTTRGLNLQKILRHGTVGMSSRGKGTLTHTKEVVNGVEEEFDDVNDDYNLIVPGDFVLGQSVEDAGPIRILESKLNESIDQLELSEEKPMEIKTVADLEAAYPDLVKQIRDDASGKAVASEQLDGRVAEALKVEKEKWEKEVSEEIDSSLQILEQDRSQIIATIRDIIDALASIEGVVDNGEEEGPPEEEEPGTGTPPPPPPPQKEKLEVEQKEIQPDLKVLFESLLKEDKNVRFKDILTETFVGKDGIKAESLADLKTKVEAEVAKAHKIIAEAVKSKIIAGGVGEKGLTEKTDEALNEAKLKERKAALEKEARAAGFTGKLD